MALDKNGIAKRIAQELQDGWYVNLGIGIPTSNRDPYISHRPCRGVITCILVHAVYGLFSVNKNI